MSSNFNMVRKPKKDAVIEEEEEEIELDEEKVQKSSSDLAKKRMFKMMGIIVGGMIVLLVILYICSTFITQTYSYTELEGILKDSAIAYFKDYPENLPTEEGNIVEIDSSNLIAAEKMKDFSEYTKEGVICSGTVQVEKSGNDYLYTPYLNCGENYTTEELYKKVTKEENLVTAGYGLYASNGAYVFRGESVNNYVKLGKSLWRIVKVTSNNNIVLINQDGVEYTQPWDNRYNEGKLYEAGINTYSASRVREYLEKVYNHPSKDDGEDILSKNDKTKLISFNLCTGKRNVNEAGSDNVTECGEVLQNQKLGLLTLSDYIYASIDPNCKTAQSKSCQNYNYLVTDYEWWLVTADKSDNAMVYKVDENGSIKKDYCSTYSIVRPVVYLNSKVLYKSGDGSLEKPYKIK